MNETVGGKDTGGGYIPRLTGQIGNAAARFFHHQAARCRIPGFELEFPETVKTSGGKISKIQGRRTGATNRLNIDRHPAEIIEIIVPAFPDIIQETPWPADCGKYP